MKHQVSVNSTTVYIQLSGDSGTWLPVIDLDTQKPLVSIYWLPYSSTFDWRDSDIPFTTA